MKKIIIAAACASYLCATNIKDVAVQTLDNNDEIKAIQKNNEAFKYYIDEQKGGYYPKLDLTVDVEAKDTETDPEGGTSSTVDQRGYNGQLDLEQLIWDGGLTPAKIEEAKSKYNENFFTNKNKVENIIFDGIEAYLDILKSKNRIVLTNENIVLNENYLTIETDKESITGDSLGRHQSEAKLHLVKNKLLEEMKKELQAKSNYEKVVGVKFAGEACTPNINQTLIPDTKAAAMEQALQNNYEIKSQMASIEKQRALLNQSKSDFYPTLKFKAQALQDDDLISNDAQTNKMSAKIELTYNLYNGNKDSVVESRNVAFLEESKSKLEVVTNKIVDELNIAYEDYVIAKKQIVELSKYLKSNEQIVSIYKYQVEGGTAKVIDLLNAEITLYNSKLSLIDAKIDLKVAYFKVLTIMGKLEESIGASDNAGCTTDKHLVKTVQNVKTKVKADDAQLEELLDENIDGEATTPAKNEQKTPIQEVKLEEVKVSKELSSKFKTMFDSEINEGLVKYDESDMSVNISGATLPLVDGKIPLTPEKRELYRAVVPKLINFLKANNDEIKEIQVNGYAASYYYSKSNSADIEAANQKVSEQRADRILSYIKKFNIDTMKDNMELVNKKFVAYGKNMSKPILKSDGSEDSDLSKRVEFRIVPL
jgi:adhesin transport system outer membrane protein